jgi:hypothetical protein
MSKMDELRWIRSTSPELIPRYLIEQVRHKDYTVDDFIKYQHNITFVSTKVGKVLNPFSHLYYLANPENIIKGILWFCIDPLTKDVIIQTYSVDKEYSKTGGAVEKLCILIKDIVIKANLKKIYWITNNPRHSQRHGFKKSKSILMEYCMEENNKIEEKNDEQPIIPEDVAGRQL